MQPLALALKPEPMDKAYSILKDAVERGDLTAASLLVRQKGHTRALANGTAGRETPFLLASITKPMTATAVMVLAGRGELALADPVRKFIPEFHGGDRDLITVQHLLTHTSGLPDMLPENLELRKRHAPLADFVAATCRTPLLFRPGSRVSYQSMGILLAAEIAERIAKRRFRDFLKEVVFDPLGMESAALGLGQHKIPETAQCQVPDEPWGWNSLYWRDLGAPWGGAHATAADVARFLGYFLEQPDGRVLKPELARQMIVDHNQGLNEPRGLGFVVKPGSFAKKCSPRAFGHSGSTGTLSWADPATQTIFVLLTTKPAVQSRATLIAPVSELAAEAAADG
jgi:CubicO group peptidase (beta-lactamase class C family)